MIRMCSFDGFRYTFLDKNERSFFLVYWFSESYILCSLRDHLPLKQGLRLCIESTPLWANAPPRPSSTKTRIKALLSLLIYCKSSSSETIFRKIRIRHYATPTVTKRFAPHYAWGNCIKTKYYLSRWYAKKSINGQLIVINGEPSPLSAFSPFGTRKMTAQKQNSTL